MNNKYFDNIIIFGSSGYVGKSLKKFFYGFKEFNFLFVSRNNPEDINIDITDPQSFNKLPINKKTVLVLLTAVSSPDFCAKNFEYSFNINVNSTIKLIDHTLNRDGKVLFFSSDVVYGENTKILDEKSDCNPLGEYAKMKRIIEIRYFKNNNVKIIRPSYIFSSDDRFSKYLLDCSIKGQKSRIFHPLYRNIIFIEDVLNGLIKVIINWNELNTNIINFGGNKLLSRKDIALFYKKYLYQNLEIILENPPKDFFKARPRSININSSILEELLGRETKNIESLFINKNLF